MRIIGKKKDVVNTNKDYLYISDLSRATSACDSNGTYVAPARTQAAMRERKTLATRERTLIVVVVAVYN